MNHGWIEKPLGCSYSISLQAKEGLDASFQQFYLERAWLSFLTQMGFTFHFNGASSVLVALLKITSLVVLTIDRLSIDWVRYLTAPLV